MASETTELTFVRCPSCRSLVPASATRCRICNNPLDGAAKSDEGDASKGGSRVRQKTMSAAPDEIAAAISQARSENAAPTPVEEPVPTPTPVNVATPTPPAAEPAGIDPLSAYLQELEDGDAGSASTVDASTATPSEVPADEPFDLDMFKGDDAGSSAKQDTLAADASVEPPTETPQDSRAGRSARKPWEMAEVDPPSENEPSSVVVPEKPAAFEKAPTPFSRSSDGEGSRNSGERGGDRGGDRFAARAESGREDRRTGGERGGSEANPPRRGLNFGAPGASGGSGRPERGPEQRGDSRGEPRGDQRNEGRGEQRGEQRGDSRNDNRNDRSAGDSRSGDLRRARDNQSGPQGAGPAGSSTPVAPQGGHQQPRREGNRPEQGRDRGGRDEQRGGHNANAGGAQARGQDRGASDRPVTAGPKMGKSNPGRLFGWLVSYSNADGKAIELREGKFFVTASSIKGTDLVLDDNSISSPHALMFVSSETGLIVQDLMSERGVFVRSRDGSGYQREEGSTTLAHGDWVRFGDLEFLVSLLPTGVDNS